MILLLFICSIIGATTENRTLRCVRITSSGTSSSSSVINQLMWILLGVIFPKLFFFFKIFCDIRRLGTVRFLTVSQLCILFHFFFFKNGIKYFLQSYALAFFIRFHFLFVFPFLSCAIDRCSVHFCGSFIPEFNKMIIHTMSFCLKEM